MTTGIHSDSLIRVIRARNQRSELIKISDYQPSYYLENAFDSMFSIQPELLMTRRRTTLYTLHSEDAQLSAAEGTLVAGLYSGVSIDQLFTPPYILVSVNLSDIASRRRISVELHHEGEETLDGLGLRSHFSKKSEAKVRTKKFYYIYEVNSFFDRIEDKIEDIPIIYGVDHCWFDRSHQVEGEEIDFPSFQFVPVLPIEPIFSGLTSLSLKYVLAYAGSRFAQLKRVTSISDEDGTFDLYFPPARAQGRDDKAPFRGAFSANGILVFHDFKHYDPRWVSFAHLQYQKKKAQQCDPPNGCPRHASC